MGEVRNVMQNTLPRQPQLTHFAGPSSVADEDAIVHLIVPGPVMPNPIGIAMPSVQYGHIPFAQQPQVEPMMCSPAVPMRDLCQRCLNHGERISRKSEAHQVCRYAACTCEDCGRTEILQRDVFSLRSSASIGPSVPTVERPRVSITGRRHRRMMCKRCAAHGVEAPYRGHHRSKCAYLRSECPYADCRCDGCLSVERLEAGKKIQGTVRHQESVDVIAMSGGTTSMPANESRSTGGLFDATCSKSATPAESSVVQSVAASDSATSNAEIPFEPSHINTEAERPSSTISNDVGSSASEDIDLDETDLPERAHELAGFLSALAASMSDMIARGAFAVTDNAESNSPAMTSTSEVASTSSNDRQTSFDQNSEASATEPARSKAECMDVTGPSIKDDDDDDDLLALLALLSPKPPTPAAESDDDDFNELLAALSPAPPKLSPVDFVQVTEMKDEDSLVEGQSGDARPPTLSVERQSREEAEVDQTMSGTSDALTERPGSSGRGAFPEAVHRNDCPPHASRPDDAERCSNRLRQAYVTAAITTATPAPGSSPTIETIAPVTDTSVPTTTPESNADLTKAVDANANQETPSPGSYYACIPCGIAFPHQTLFQVHIGFHSWSNPFKCNRCGHQAANALAFNVHLYETMHDDGLRSQEQASSSAMRPNNGVSPTAVPLPSVSTATRQSVVVLNANQQHAFHCSGANALGRTMRNLRGPYGVDPAWAASEMRLLQERWASRGVQRPLSSPMHLSHRQAATPARLPATTGTTPTQNQQKRVLRRTKAKEAASNHQALNNLVDNLIRMTRAQRVAPSSSSERHLGST